MNKAKRKHTRKPPQRRAQSQPHTADPSIALGLRYFAAWAAYTTADAERDEMDGEVRAKYPQAPAEICFPNSPNPNVLCPRDDILRKPEPARSALLRMLGAEERKRAKIDRETGYVAKVAEVKRLEELADALRVLWFQEPATTVCGITLKLRAWLLHADPYPSSDDFIERAALAALADAERLCGVHHMTQMDRPPESPAFAERTRTDFSALLCDEPAK